MLGQSVPVFCVQRRIAKFGQISFQLLAFFWRYNTAQYGSGEKKLLQGFGPEVPNPSLEALHYNMTGKCLVS